MSFLPCSCPSCCQNINDVDCCIRKDDRNDQRRLVIAADDEEDADNEDITKLTIPELKMLCRICSLTLGGRKKDLIS